MDRPVSTTGRCAGNGIAHGSSMRCLTRLDGRLRSALLLVLALPFALAPTLAWAKGEFQVEQQDDLFSVTADAASLSSVITRLSELTEIPMNIAEGQDTQVTLDLRDYTLESLITELTSSSMIVRKSVDGTDVISEVVFMLGSEGSGVAAAALPSGEPNEGIIAGDEVQEQLTEDTPAQQPAREPITVTEPGQEAQTGGTAPAVINPETGEPAEPSQ